jgi:hypothetical protein
VAEAATAVPRPVVYNHAEGWGDPVTEPGNVTVGQGGSPYAGSLHWSYWAGFTAGATGKYHQIAPGCTPTYQCPYTHRYVAVTLSRAVHHGAKLFYTRMKWAYHQRGVRRIQRWYFRTYPGATVPGWQR